MNLISLSCEKAVMKQNCFREVFKKQTKWQPVFFVRTALKFQHQRFLHELMWLFLSTYHWVSLFLTHLLFVCTCTPHPNHFMYSVWSANSFLQTLTSSQCQRTLNSYIWLHYSTIKCECSHKSLCLSLKHVETQFTNLESNKVRCMHTFAQVKTLHYW